MAESDWVLHPQELDDDELLKQAVLAVHREIYQSHFADDLMANNQLDIQVRAYRRLEDWRLMLILTPWMLARLFFPARDPELEIAKGWRRQDREGEDYLLLGPLMDLLILGQKQHAHLNYHPRLGHYLLQPISLNMQQYDSAASVFAAWNEVIKTRDENMARFQKDCPWQKEISRREFFRRFKS